MLVNDDIGQCDDCGSEDGPRVSIPRVIMINGEPCCVLAWVCPHCR